MKNCFAPADSGPLTDTSPVNCAAVGAPSAARATWPVLFDQAVTAVPFCAIAQTAVPLAAVTFSEPTALGLGTTVFTDTTPVKLAPAGTDSFPDVPSTARRNCQVRVSAGVVEYRAKRGLPPESSISTVSAGRLGSGNTQLWLVASWN